MQKEEKTNINLALSKKLLQQLKEEAVEQELSYSALIRLILQAYFNTKNNKNE